MSHDMCGFLCQTIAVAVEVCQWRGFRCPTLDDAFFVARHMWLLSSNSGCGSVPVFPVFLVYTFLLLRVVSFSFIVLSLFCFSFFLLFSFFFAQPILSRRNPQRFCPDGILQPFLSDDSSCSIPSSNRTDTPETPDPAPRMTPSKSLRQAQK